MGKIIEWLRNLVQLKILLKSLIGRYGRIITNQVELGLNTLKLVLISINYLTALILIPASVFYVTYLISKDYLISIIVSLVAIAIYLIVMSNYFSKGVHKFGANAKEIKQNYHNIKMEHKLVLKSLKSDTASGRLLVLLVFIILVEFIFFYSLFLKFDVATKLKTVIIVFIAVQILFVLIEYILSGYGLFSTELFKTIFSKKLLPWKRKDKANKPLPKNYVQSDSFDELIVESESNKNVEENDSNMEEANTNISSSRKKELSEE